MNLVERQLEEIGEEFAAIETGYDRYEYLRELADSLPPYPESLRNDDHRVAGCPSPVWLSFYGRQGKFYFQGDSDVSLDRGVLLLLRDMLNGVTLREAAEAEINLLPVLHLNMGPWVSYQQDVQQITDALKNAACRLQGRRQTKAGIRNT